MKNRPILRGHEGGRSAASGYKSADLLGEVLDLITERLPLIDLHDPGRRGLVVTATALAEGLGVSRLHALPARQLSAHR